MKSRANEVQDACLVLTENRSIAGQEGQVLSGTEPARTQVLREKVFDPATFNFSSIYELIEKADIVLASLVRSQVDLVHTLICISLKDRMHRSPNGVEGRRIRANGASILYLVHIQERKETKAKNEQIRKGKRRKGRGKR